jgi:hypothetical protein
MRCEAGQVSDVCQGSGKLRQKFSRLELWIRSEFEYLPSLCAFPRYAIPSYALPQPRLAYALPQPRLAYALPRPRLVACRSACGCLGHPIGAQTRW